MNKVIYCGRIATDLELKETRNGKKYIFFNLAVPREYDSTKTDFINCVIWNKGAEFLAKYQSKGNMILIEGSTESYKDKDNITKTRCLVKSTQYFDNKKTDENTDMNENIKSPVDNVEDSDIELTNDDLPF